MEEVWRIAKVVLSVVGGCFTLWVLWLFIGGLIRGARDVAYFRSAWLIFERILASAERRAQLTDELPDNPLLMFDKAWKSRMAAEVKVWQEQAVIGEGLDPPARLREAHKKLVEGLDMLAIAGDQMMRSFDTADRDLWHEASAIMDEGCTLLVSAEAELRRSR